MVGTFAWNTTRHLEAWYGIMGLGAVCHTLNPRLSDRDITYIADTGDDKFILADYTLLPTILKIAPQLPKLQGIIVLTDRCVSHARCVTVCVFVQHLHWLAPHTITTGVLVASPQAAHSWLWCMSFQLALCSAMGCMQAACP